MKGEKGGQQQGEGNTLDELSDESFGQSLNTSILGEDGSQQQNIIYTTSPNYSFKLN